MTNQKWRWVWAVVFIVVIVALPWVLDLPFTRSVGEYTEYKESLEAGSVRDCGYCTHYLEIDLLGEEWHQIPPWYYDLTDEEKEEFFEKYILQVEEKMRKSKQQME